MNKIKLNEVIHEDMYQELKLLIRKFHNTSSFSKRGYENYSISGFNKSFADFLCRYFNYLGGNITYYRSHKKAMDNIFVPTWYFYNSKPVPIKESSWNFIRQIYKDGEKEVDLFPDLNTASSSIAPRYNEFERNNNFALITDGEVSFRCLQYLWREFLKNKKDRNILEQWMVILGLLSHNKLIPTVRLMRMLLWLDDVMHINNSNLNLVSKKLNYALLDKKNYLEEIYNTGKLEQLDNKFINEILIFLEKLLIESSLKTEPIGFNVLGHLALRCVERPKKNCLFPLIVRKYLESIDTKLLDTNDFDRSVLIVPMLKTEDVNITIQIYYFGIHSNLDMNKMKEIYENLVMVLDLFAYKTLLPIILNNEVELQILKRTKELASGAYKIGHPLKDRVGPVQSCIDSIKFSLEKGIPVKNIVQKVEQCGELLKRVSNLGYFLDLISRAISKGTKESTFLEKDEWHSDNFYNITKNLKLIIEKNKHVGNCNLRLSPDLSLIDNLCIYPWIRNSDKKKRCPFNIFYNEIFNEIVINSLKHGKADSNQTIEIKWGYEVIANENNNKKVCVLVFSNVCKGIPNLKKIGLSIDKWLKWDTSLSGAVGGLFFIATCLEATNSGKLYVKIEKRKSQYCFSIGLFLKGLEIEKRERDGQNKSSAYR